MQVVGGFNFWDSEDELEERRREAKELAAQLFPGDSLREIQVINLAQSLSPKMWHSSKGVGARLMGHVMDEMVKNGVPLNEPPELGVGRTSE